MDTKTLIAEFGGTKAEMARRLGMSPQRINLWDEELTPHQRDAVLAALVRNAAGARVEPTRPAWIPKFIWDDVRADGE